MTDQELMERLSDNLEKMVEILEARQRKSKLNSDCVGDCDAAHKRCMASAGSTLEQAVCNSDYMLCISSC